MRIYSKILTQVQNSLYSSSVLDNKIKQPKFIHNIIKLELDG